MDNNRIIRYNLKDMCKEEDYIIIVPDFFLGFMKPALMAFHEEHNGRYGNYISFPGVIGIDNARYFSEMKAFRDTLKQEQEIKRLKEVEEEFIKLKSSLEVVKSYIKED